MASGDALPHGARRLALGEIRVIFLRDKIVVAPSGSDKHFTLHLGPHSGELDIHETTARGPDTSHERLYSISRANLGRLVQEFAPEAFTLYRKAVRPLRPGWMVRRQVGAVVGLIPSDEVLLEVSHLGPKRTLIIDESELVARAEIPDVINDLYELPDGQAFTLVDWRRTQPRRIGTGFKARWPDGSPRLIWFRDLAVKRLLWQSHPTLLALAAKYGTFHRPLPWVSSPSRPA